MGTFYLTGKMFAHNIKVEGCMPSLVFYMVSKKAIFQRDVHIIV